MRVEADSTKYFLKVHQSNPALPHLILFHGFMGSGEAFTPLLKDLSKFCNPITIDLKGHGKSSGPEKADHYSTDQQVGELTSVISRLKFQSLFLYGYSMGGRLALQLALETPELFSGLILESTHCGIADPDLRKQRRKIDRVRAEQIIDDFSTFLEGWSQLPLFNAKQSSDSDYYYQIMEQQHPPYLAASLRGFGAGNMPCVCDRLSSFELPVQLIAGSEDQKYVDKMSEIAQLLPSSTLDIVDGAAHRVHVDRPGDVTGILNSFIQSHV